MKLLYLFILMFFVVPVHSADIALEKLQSAFIQKMINYVEWPTIGGDSFVIGVLNNDKLYESMMELNDKIVFGKSIKVIAIDKVSRANKLQILCTDSGQKLKSPMSGMLVITTSQEGLQSHSMINFFLEDGKLRFDINQTHALESNLKINSRLLKLARHLK